MNDCETRRLKAALFELLALIELGLVGRRSVACELQLDWRANNTTIDECIFELSAASFRELGWDELSEDACGFG